MRVIVSYFCLNDKLKGGKTMLMLNEVTMPGEKKYESNQPCVIRGLFC